MNIDLFTRQEASKVESILSDLVTDLEVVSLIPDDFALWLRDDLVSLVDQDGDTSGDGRRNQSISRFGGSALLSLTDTSRTRAINSASLSRSDKPALLHSSGGGGAGGGADSSALAEGNMQRLARAGAFVEVASHYGDPADTMNNTAVLQVGEFSYLERTLLDLATTVGHVDREDINAHRLAVRGLVDMLRQNDYAPAVKRRLAMLFPLRSSSSSRTRGDEDAAEADSAVLAHAAGEANASSEDEEEERESARMRESRWFSDFLSSTSYNKGRSRSRSSSGTSSSSSNKESSAKHRLRSRRAVERAECSAAPALDTAEACARGALSEGLVGFTHVMRVLAQLVHRRNCFTVHDDLRRYQILHEALNKEKSASANVQSLNREYEQVCASRRQRVASLDDEIAKLEEELVQVEQSADAELQQFRNECAGKRAEQQVAYAQRLEQQRAQSEQVMQSLAKLQGSNAEETAQKRSLRAKKEAAVSGAIAEYDTQLHATRHILKRLQHETDEDTTKIVTLEAQLKEMRENKTEYELEQRDAEQKKEHTNVIQQHLQHNARVVQAFFRAYLARLSVAEDLKKATRRPKKRAKSAK